MPTPKKDPGGPRPPLPSAFLATWFGSGLLPYAPGTWGSLAALPFAWIIRDLAGPVGLAAAAIAVFAIGVWAAGDYARRSGRPDPGAVVIDEVVGQWIVLIAVPLDVWTCGLGFVLFRLADIVKPWPASWADRRIKGGLGIMLDDVLAAVYAGALLYFVHPWLGGI